MKFVLENFAPFIVLTVNKRYGILAISSINENFSDYHGLYLYYHSDRIQYESEEPKVIGVDIL